MWIYFQIHEWFESPHWCSHKDSQKPEVLREEFDKSLNISHNSESIDEDSSLADADKKDTSSLAQAVLEGNRCEIDRVFDIIEATGKCQFCDYQCPTSRKVGFSGPPDIWDHIKEQHEREFDWFAWRFPDVNNLSGNNPNLLDFAQAALSHLPCSDSNLLSDRGLL